MNPKQMKVIEEREETKLFRPMNEINFTDFKDYCFQVELSQYFYVIHLCVGLA